MGNRQAIKLLFIITVSLLITNGLNAIENISKPNKEWTENRFSMFIHWGLYSRLGGVWDGKPVKWGYSEQIQSFAGIFGDYYAATADTFTGEKWNADSIAALAKASGMKSIVMTAKHHDGFSMYATKYSKYNIAEATPFGRDPLMELSKACKKAGLKFGIYFSLIDWHFPQAYPISSHNADPATPEHHEHNMAQVRELLTGYGPVSEIWFDMGALTREQSRQLYDLVTSLQPECMVSGRLGNDFGDFAVMADNACPDYNIGIPWQTAGSVFKETWGYRSWQKRDNLSGKISEKINTLKNIVRHGGNYLLNIGPRGDGSVVEYERDLLLAIGAWLKDSSNIIYPSPTKNIGMPEENNIKPLRGTVLNYENASPVFGYSSFDYYSSFRSIIAYNWLFKGCKAAPHILYHAGDSGKTVIFNLNGKIYPVKLEGGKKILSVPTKINISRNLVLTTGRSSFGEQFINPGAIDALAGGIYTKTDLKTAQDAGWQVVPQENNAGFVYECPVKWRRNIWLAHIIESDTECGIIARFSGEGEGGAADAVEIWLNGKQLMKKGYTNIYPVPEYVSLPLRKGQNYLVVKLHNRFNDNINYRFSTDLPQTKYKLKLPFNPPVNSQINTLSLTLQGQRGGADTGLRDIEILLK